MLAAAAAVAVLAGAVGFVAGRAGERSPSSGSSGVVALAEAALADGGNPRVELTGGDGVEAAQLVTDADSGVGYVVLDALAPLPQGSTYQLWRLDGPTPVSLGVLGDGTASALAVSLPPSLPHETAQLAITAENGGGAARPTGPVVASGFLPAAA